MANHRFILLLEGVTEIDEPLENRVFEAGCDDALLGKRDGIVYLDFNREAPTLAEALASATEALKAAGFDVFPQEVEKGQTDETERRECS